MGGRLDDRSSFAVRTIDGRARALIFCKKCFREDTVSLQGGSVSRAACGSVFASRGWLLGQNRRRDICPSCRRQKPAMHGESTPARRRAAYLAIEARIDREEQTDAGPPAEHHEPGPMADALKPLLENMTMETAVNDISLPDWKKDVAFPDGLPVGYKTLPVAKMTEIMHGKPIGHAFRSAGDARHHAIRFLAPLMTGVRPDDRFDISELPDESGTFTWRLSEGEAPAWWETTTLIPRRAAPMDPTHTFSSPAGAREAARALLRRLGVIHGQEGQHFKIVPDGEGFRFALLGLQVGVSQSDAAPPLPPSPAAAGRPPKSAEIEAHLGLPQTEIRQMTRDDRRRINDCIGDLYNVLTERWVSDWSDRKMAESMDVPRAWVTEVREQLYGPHDRNEAAEKHASQLDDAIAAAEAAATRLMAMAGEAEDMMLDLKKARAKLS